MSRIAWDRPGDQLVSSGTPEVLASPPDLAESVGSEDSPTGVPAGLEIKIGSSRMEWLTLLMLIAFSPWRDNGESNTMEDWQIVVVETSPTWMHLSPWLPGRLSSCKSEEVVWSGERQTGPLPEGPLFPGFSEIHAGWAFNRSDPGLCVTPRPLLYWGDPASVLLWEIFLAMHQFQIVIASWHSSLEAVPPFWLLPLHCPNGKALLHPTRSSWMLAMLEMLPVTPGNWCDDPIPVLTRFLLSESGHSTLHPSPCWMHQTLWSQMELEK